MRHWRYWCLSSLYGENTGTRITSRVFMMRLEPWLDYTEAVERPSHTSPNRNARDPCPLAPTSLAPALSSLFFRRLFRPISTLLILPSLVSMLASSSLHLIAGMLTNAVCDE